MIADTNRLYNQQPSGHTSTKATVFYTHTSTQPIGIDYKLIGPNGLVKLGGHSWCITAPRCGNERVVPHAKKEPDDNKGNHSTI